MWDIVCTTHFTTRTFLLIMPFFVFSFPIILSVLFCFRAAD